MAGEVRTIWDIPLERLFKLVLQFYREEKDTIHLEYQQKIKLMALYKQEKLGPYTSGKDTETGPFDIIGSDRRKAWQELAVMTKDEARRGIASLLDAATPKLHEYVLAQWKSQQGHAAASKASPTHIIEGIQSATRSIEASDQAENESPGRKQPHHITFDLPYKIHHNNQEGEEEDRDTKVLREEEAGLALPPAALWCNPKAASQFIAQVQGVPSSCVRINPGEVIDIVVPTNTAASAVFWEFVVVGGILGFGLNFQPTHGNIVFELLPVTKRDCTQDVVQGCHHYRSEGTYNLHFDNSYSSDIAVVVYYRVFYHRLP